MEHRALVVDQARRETVSNRFLRERSPGPTRLVCGSIPDARSAWVRDERVEVGRLCRQLDLAAAPEIAVDALARDHPLDGLHRLIEGLVESPRPFQAERAGNGRNLPDQAVVAVSAVASRSGAGHASGVEDDDIDSRAGHGEGGRQSGEPPADHRRLATCRQAPGLGALERRRRVEPVGEGLHGPGGQSGPGSTEETQPVHTTVWNHVEAHVADSPEVRHPRFRRRGPGPWRVSVPREGPSSRGMRPPRTNRRLRAGPPGWNSGPGSCP